MRLDLREGHPLSQSFQRPAEDPADTPQCPRCPGPRCGCRPTRELRWRLNRARTGTGTPRYRYLQTPLDVSTHYVARSEMGCRSRRNPVATEGNRSHYAVAAGDAITAGVAGCPLGIRIHAAR